MKFKRLNENIGLKKRHLSGGCVESKIHNNFLNILDLCLAEIYAEFFGYRALTKEWNESIFEDGENGSYEKPELMVNFQNC